MLAGMGRVLNQQREHDGSVSLAVCINFRALRWYGTWRSQAAPASNNGVNFRCYFVSKYTNSQTQQ